MCVCVWKQVRVGVRGRDGRRPTRDPDGRMATWGPRRVCSACPPCELADLSRTGRNADTGEARRGEVPEGEDGREAGPADDHRVDGLRRHEDGMIGFCGMIHLTMLLEQFGGDRSFLADVARHFFEVDLPGQLADLRGACALGDRDAVARVGELGQ